MKGHKVVALLNDPHPPFELACAAEVFGVTWPDLPQYYEFVICTYKPGPVKNTLGHSLLVEEGLNALRTADTIVIPGWEPVGSTVEREVLEELRAAHRRGARIASICNGAFVLAQAGLLDGRRATTHWLRTALLAARFPEIAVEADVLFIDHGDVISSAGSGAGIDMCLHLVRKDHGASYAAQIARHMVLPPHREGSQLQYAVREIPAGERADDSLAQLLDWAVSRLDARLTLESMADHAGVSSRTLARRFTEQLGISPGQWLLAQRLDAARTLLEQTDLPVEVIATRVGLSSALNLRRRFRTAFGTTPGAYRRTFAPPPVPVSA
ncbi:GlxA family transcriptional regulator [Streptomyces solicathayae]|uniref:Helix-turn-helix domain-containing protein n=1 Tax=Streptomyces solicathayae TaxID=3081768 RepID=A0ABZ0LLD9_9ACTN|nr:helix-turn-helix domain-containing protein [Streptomyces sp. HUAS YS2]WOX19986.1 helix-turn-helix domain-containing protein [Streptomyces sp. HUAS YS2]